MPPGISPEKRPVSDAGRLALIAAALTGLGVVMVYSASLFVAARRFGQPTLYLGRQLVWVATGSGLMLLASQVDYHLYRRLRWAILGTMLAALAGVLLFGQEYNGARRWFSVAGFSFQPSEFAKLAVVIYLADLLSRKQATIREFWRGFVPPVLVFGATFLLIAMEPDLGTSLLVAAVMLAMLFVAGIRLAHVCSVLCVAAPAVVYLAWYKLDYVAQRVDAWLQPELDLAGKGYQAWQSLLALGSGGIFGRGLGNGWSKLFFLPEAHSDFVLAVIGEELGLGGTLLVVFLFAALLWTGLRIFQRAPDLFGSLLALGITLTIALQAALNVAVVTRAVPTKGISLPLVSYGGSSITFFLAGVGILMNVASAARAAAPLPATNAKMAPLNPARA